MEAGNPMGGGRQKRRRPLGLGLRMRRGVLQQASHEPIVLRPAGRTIVVQAADDQATFAHAHLIEHGAVFDQLHASAAHG